MGLFTRAGLPGFHALLWIEYLRGSPVVSLSHGIRSTQADLVYCESSLAVGGRMFGVIRHYHFDKKDSAEIDRLIQDQFVPIISKAQGFVRYYWLDTGAGEGASFGVFKDKAGADESVRLAADFVRTKMATLLKQKPEIIEGPIKAHD